MSKQPVVGARGKQLPNFPMARAMVFVLLLFALFVSEASAQTQINSCTTISSPGVYVLSQSIINSPVASCINITSSNVIFDGAGYTVDGIDATGSYGISGHGVIVYDGVNWYNSTTTLTNVTVKNLVVTDWAFGITYNYAANGSIASNIVNSNAHGIYLYFSNSNTLTSNTVSFNDPHGISLGYGTNNTITNNNVSSNIQFGIALTSFYSGNIIYNNHFKNTYNLGWGGTIYTNTWNTAKQAGTNIIGGPYLGGNYWANPSGTGFSQTCTDGNGDGICDSSYSLASGNIDYLPLTVPGNISTTNVTNSTICGVKFNDLNGNGVKDASEAGLSNWTIQVKNANGTVIATSVTNSTGGYCVTLPAGNYTVSEVLQAGWNQTSPLAPGTYTLNLTAGQTVQNISFGNLLSIPLPPDITCSKFWPNAQRGFSRPIWIYYSNLGRGTGNEIQNAVLVDTLPSVIDPANVAVYDGLGNPIPFSVDIFGNIVISLGTVPPESQRLIRIMATVPTTVPLGTVLVNDAVVSADNDVDTTNNFCTATATVVAAVDPNDKEISPSQFIKGDEGLSFLVQYENIGNAPTSLGVFVTDILDQNLDITGFDASKVTGVSGKATFDSATRKLEWKDLVAGPGSALNPGETRAFAFQLKPKSGLAHGTKICNKASIVFDAEAPIETPLRCVEIDSVPPILTIDSPIAGDNLINNAESASVTIIGTATDSSLSSVKVKATNGTTTQEVSAAISGTAPNFVFTATLNLAGFSDGTITFTATATDLVGNQASDSETATLDKTPPDTAITSAVDGNGAAVPNGGSTLSNSITFTFTGTDNIGVSGFECSLDGATFSSCTSPVSYTGLAVGSRTFQVRAADTAGNTDSTPASFTWTILTPAQATQNLITQVQNLGLPSGPLNQGQVNALTAKLNAALNSLNEGNTGAACNQLTAFINQVNALTQPPTNKPLTPTQGNVLIAQAQAIKASLGC